MRDWLRALMSKPRGEEHEEIEEKIGELEEQTLEVEARLAALDPEWDVIGHTSAIAERLELR